ANSYVTVSSKIIINKSCTVDVYNSLGLKVMRVNKTAPGNSFDINTSSLPSGRYRMILFNNNDKIGDANFVVVR
ncbi:MAG TPA: T9SS type A sorting domain-containing protein, partial [Segetibacter sp.]